MIEPIRWSKEGVRILDQTLLPSRVEYVICRDYHEVADAIRTMKIRGAPAIGIAAAMGVALGAKGIDEEDRDRFFHEFGRVCQEFLSTRPTAVNLAWAINRMKAVICKEGEFSLECARESLLCEALRILDEDIRTNMLIGKHGEALISSGQRILTHCNAGALATGGYGTALGIIRAVWDAGKRISVLADETRPALQGARLTAWELIQDDIPVTLITDNMAGECMRRGMVDAVIVGADRITTRGDAANKIGTYTLSVMARTHNIPFYVAAPVSTIDFDLELGDDIPIEERGSEEITHINGKRIAPEGIGVFNPAFDVTPARLISAIITEKGIITPPYEDSIYKLKHS
ncbi:S-methyl-5-thioribose-1-phosphate isomerase [bacterium]|nr:S-methyl-5-thioribose-1-phosphate isomerase [bacterium]